MLKGELGSGKVRSHDGLRATIVICLVFLLMFAAGLAVTEDYFMGCDEYWEIGILQSNIRAYANKFLGEDSQIVYSYEAMGIHTIIGDVEVDHGQAAYYPFALYLLQPQFLEPYYPLAELSVAYHYYTYFLCFTAVIAFYLLVRELFGDKWMALMCAAALFLMPRFFAESHYNNKDMVLMALLMDTSCFAVRATRHRRLGDAMLFAFFAALAANTKIIGLFFFGVFGIFYLIYIIYYRASPRSGMYKRSLSLAAIVIVAFCLIYYAVTPAMWGDPIGFFQYSLDNTFHFSRWHGQVLFDGEVYTPENGELPRRYLLQLILFTTPPFITVLAGLGLFAALKSLVKRGSNSSPAVFDQLFFSFAICICALVPLLVSTVSRPVVYNGWRHFYFSFVGIAMLMALGVEFLFRRVPRAGRCAILVFLLFTCLQNVAKHPYQYVYYNFLTGEDVSQHYEQDYWFTSTRDAVYYVAENSKGEVTVRSWDGFSDQFLAYAVMYLSPEDQLRVIAAQDPDADFLLENTTYSILEGAGPVPENYQLEHVIAPYGHPVQKIYRRIG